MVYRGEKMSYRSEYIWNGPSNERKSHSSPSCLPPLVLDCAWWGEGRKVKVIKGEGAETLTRSLL